MQWYYLDEDRQQVPFDENYVEALASDRRLRAETKVWNETLPAWIAAANAFPKAFPGINLPPESTTPSRMPASVPAQSSIVSQSPPSQTIRPSTPETRVLNQDLREMVKDCGSYLNANGFWLRLISIIFIIGGVVQCLTIVGLLFGWLPIWAGVLLWKTASSAKMAEVAGTLESLEDSLYRLGLFFRLWGIWMLVFFVLYFGFIALVLSGTIAIPNFPTR